MKRTILALAIAGLSIAAYASPPPGGGRPGPIDVNVTNPVLPVEVSNADPVTVRDVDTPALQPFRYSDAMQLTAISNQMLITTVPDGKRLVIERFSWSCGMSLGYEVVFAGLRSSQYGDILDFFRINAPHPSASSELTLQDGAELTRIYFEPGEEVWLTVSKNGGPATAFHIAISGYLLTL